MRDAITFDDVLIVPKFSSINSRKDPSLKTNIRELRFELPIISANMDTVTGPEMANAMVRAGAQACLHRFCTIDQAVKDFCQVVGDGAMVSIGLGKNEIDRAVALFGVAAHTFVIDVAHGAQISVVEQVKALREVLGPYVNVVVGNFASAESVKEFIERTGNSVDAFKIGIGPGSACTTRTKTGVGYPQLSAVMEISRLLKNTGVAVIADGGMRTPGDVAKALGAGAHMVMLGGMLAGTDETPGETVWKSDNQYFDKHVVFPRRVEQDGSIVLMEDVEVNLPKYKKYRGSASKESYEIQGKDVSWRTTEGESFFVPHKGPVKNILQDIEGGLRSAMSYVNALNISEFHANCEFVRISPSTVVENGAHGKGNNDTGHK